MPADASVLEDEKLRGLFETYWSVPGQSAAVEQDLFALVPPLQVGRYCIFRSFIGVVHPLAQMLRARVATDVKIRSYEHAFEMALS